LKSGQLPPCTIFKGFAYVTHPANQIFRFILKLVLGLFAALFAISLLAAALVALALSVLTALITGRKPAPAMMFGRFQQFSRQAMWPAGSRARDGSTQAHGGQVVDVEVREIPDDRRQP
jgi:hypothetical protein